MKKIFIMLILFMMLVIIFFTVYKENKEKVVNSVNDKTFIIERISIYSGASGENTSKNIQNPEWNLNIYQYSDISIYLNRITEFSDKNNIKRVYIDNIDLGTPNVGSPKLYYLNPLNYGTDKTIEDDEIVDNLEFNILNSDNSKNDISYSIPIIFQDLSNPITLKYVNTNIVQSYKISNQNKIIFNGTLLKLSQVNPKDIENKISFYINIKTADDRVLTRKIEIDIPLKDNNDKSIYDGNIIYDYNLDLSL